MTTILVIEDTQSLREEIVELLQIEGFEVLSAGDGRAGLALAQAKLPDLIVCDVSMPELNGYETLKAIREDETTQSIPFIFLTARVEKDDIRQGMGLGADDYLTKPFSIEEFLASIAVRLQKQAVFEKKVETELNALRSSISQTLPHELRTPLNGILGFSELLIECLDGEKQMMAESIHGAAQNLYRTIQNYLLYAELEIAETRPNFAELSKSTTEFSSCDLLLDLIQKKAHQFDRLTDLSLEFTKDLTVSMPIDRLIKIVEEIVDNCFRYSKSGSPVKVSVERSEFDHVAIMSFCDYGRGMTLEQINHIGAYMQFERKLYEQQGSGLGLTLACRLAKLYGGDLKIASIPDEQTIVTLRLPQIDR